MSETVKIPSNPVIYADRNFQRASNDTLTDGNLMGTLVTNAQYYQHAGRPLYHLLVNQPNTVVNNATTTVQIVRPNLLDGGGRNLNMRVGVIPFEGTGTTTQALVHQIDGGTSYDTFYPGAISSTSYPESFVTVDTQEITQSAISGLFEAHTIGTNSSSAPYLFSGSMFEDFVEFGDTDLTVTGENLAEGKDILAVKTDASSKTDRLRSTFRATWRLRRLVYNWSNLLPGSTNYIQFDTSPSNFRYIFDQAYGAGGSTITATSPAIVLPLMYSASGLFTQVRVYVFVYAAMAPVIDPGPGTGSIGVANKDSGGTMSGTMTAITNTPTITGTTFHWYPTLATWNPATAPYFNGYAGSTPDHIVIGTKTSGIASVRIASLALVAFPYR